MTAPFGVSQFTTWPQSFEQDLELYREAGVEFIEVCEAKLQTAAPDIQLDRLEETGLRVSSVQPRIHSLYPDLPRPEPRLPKERMGRMQESIRLFGRHFPGTTLVTITGAAPGGDYASAFRTAAREYGELARYAADHGVRVAVEPLNPILMNVDTFICSLAHARRIVDAVDHPQFGLFLDVWHVWEDFAAEDQIGGFAGKIFGVHINDWRTPRAFGDRYLPGEGEIPLVRLLRAVRRTGYAGPYTLEIFSELRLDSSLWADPRRTVMAGRDAFAEIWRQICA